MKGHSYFYETAFSCDVYEIFIDTGTCMKIEEISHENLSALKMIPSLCALCNGVIR
jgi:hypothetical protein